MDTRQHGARRADQRSDIVLRSGGSRSRRPIAARGGRRLRRGQLPRGLDDSSADPSGGPRRPSFLRRRGRSGGIAIAQSSGADEPDVTYDGATSSSPEDGRAEGHEHDLYGAEVSVAGRGHGTGRFPISTGCSTSGYPRSWRRRAHPLSLTSASTSIRPTTPTRARADHRSLRARQRGACSGKDCGSAVNNCGQSVSCGSCSLPRRRRTALPTSADALPTGPQARQDLRQRGQQLRPIRRLRPCSAPRRARPGTPNVCGCIRHGRSISGKTRIVTTTAANPSPAAVLLPLRAAHGTPTSVGVLPTRDRMSGKTCAQLRTIAATRLLRHLLRTNTAARGMATSAGTPNSCDPTALRRGRARSRLPREHLCVAAPQSRALEACDICGRADAIDPAATLISASTAVASSRK